MPSILQKQISKKCLPLRTQMKPVRRCSAYLGPPKSHIAKTNMFDTCIYNSICLPLTPIPEGSEAYDYHIHADSEACDYHIHEDSEAYDYHVHEHSEAFIPITTIFTKIRRLILMNTQRHLTL